MKFWNKVCSIQFDRRQHFYSYIRWLIFLLVLCSYILKMQKSKHSTMTHNKPKHIFILRSYYYGEKNSFIPPNKNVFATIFNAENERQGFNASNLDIHCVLFSKSGYFPIKSVKASLLPLYNTANVLCRLDTYRIVCQSESAINPSHFGIKIANKLLIQDNIFVPSPIRRRLVFCPGRIYNFERWHILATTMELYSKMYGVQLTVIHVQSVLSQIYELLRVYERDGLLEMRPYMGMPIDLDTIAYNPNAETVWTGQTVHMQDCLYAYRENTDYMIFADWDDIINVPAGKQLLPLLDDFFAAHPSTASIYIQRFEGNTPTLDTMSAQNMSIFDFWTKGIDYSLSNERMAIHGKSICRPNLIESLQPHYPLVYHDGYRQENITKDLLYIIHARIQTDKLDQLLELSPLIGLFQKRINGTNINLSEMPRQEMMVGQIVQCFFQIRSLISARNTTESRCPNHYLCSFFDSPLQCLVYQSQWDIHSVNSQFNLYNHYKNYFDMVIAIFKSTSLNISEGCKSNIKK